MNRISIGYCLAPVIVTPMATRGFAKGQDNDRTNPLQFTLA